MKEQMRIGMVGYGGIGRAHSLGYREIPLLYPGRKPIPVLQRVATSRPETAQSAKEEAGFAEASSDLAALTAATSVDVVDITTPNHLHREAAEAAISAGKAVYCEKPLAHTVEDARAIAAAVEGGSAPFGMVFQYRFIPAIMKAKELVDTGRLGRVFTYRAEYLHSGYQDPNRPLSWRMKKEEGGSGALGDLGSHVIDLVRYLVGEFASVQGHLETFISERPLSKGAQDKGPVTVDDVAWFQARMANGAVGTVEASRFATGTLDDLRIWIYAEKGAVKFDLMDPNFLYFFDETGAKGDFGGDRGWQRFDTVANYPGAKAPPPRAPLGWHRAHAESQYRFIRAVADGAAPSPSVVDGLRAQLVMDAVERSSAHEGLWTEVDPV
jgi:predicted dehydrogenase